jgi:UrcA family protein
MKESSVAPSLGPESEKNQKNASHRTWLPPNNARKFHASPAECGSESETIDQENPMKIFVTLAGAVVLGVASINPAIADTEIVSKTVKFGDLDINGPEGAKKLYKRIKVAAESLCSPVDGRLLTQHQVFTRCVRGSVQRAVVQVQSPALTQYAMQRGIDVGAPATVASTDR